MSTIPQDVNPATAPASGSGGPEPHPTEPVRAVKNHRVRRFAERYAVIAVWIAMFAIYAAAEPNLFLRPATLQVIFSSQQPLVFMAVALLCTVCVGEFVDLSVPSVFGFSATILAVLNVNAHWNIWAAALVAVLGGVLVGLINAYLVVIVGVNTIVVTLGMSTLLLGVSLWMSQLNTVSGLPADFAQIALLPVGGLPISFYYGVALVLLFAYVMYFTPLGKHMRFVGSSREVSRLSGVRVQRIRFGAFVIAGLVSGVGAVIGVAALGGFNPTTATSYLLPVFASVFLGTAIIEPGRFNPIGTFIGIYFLETGILGLQLLGLQAWVSPVFYGGVLIIAVTISTLLQKRTR